MITLNVFTAIEQAKDTSISDTSKVPVTMPEPCYRRDFCMLILYLIQVRFNDHF